jgi:hypothetical protein
MSTLLASDSDLGHAFSDAWALLREEVDGVVDVTRSPGLLSHPAETVPAQHRMQHAITAQREAAAARRLDVLMLALPRTDPRRHAWLEAGDHAQIAGRWLASHPSERLGLVCSCSEFSEMLVSYLGVDSPAASSPGVLGASFSGYSGGRQRFVVDAGGWEVERVPFRRPPLSRRGEALWERAEAGSGLLGAASSESAAGSGWLRACGC